VAGQFAYLVGIRALVGQVFDRSLVCEANEVLDWGRGFGIAAMDRPPDVFRGSWPHLGQFAASQLWLQRVIHRSALSLRRAGFFPTSTDDLARAVVDDLEQQLPDVAAMHEFELVPGRATTRRDRGRDPGIEAAVVLKARGVLVAVDGKWPVTGQGIQTVAAQAALRHAVDASYRDVFVVIVTPLGGDVTDPGHLWLALETKVAIAPTWLEVRRAA